MRLRVALVASFVLVGGCATTQTPRRNSDCSRAWRISFPKIPLSDGERIVATEVSITSGRVIGIAYIPPGWSVAVDAESGGRAKVSGGILVGAAALPSTDDLRGFAVVCDTSSEHLTALGQPEFALEGTLSTTVDFESTRIRRFAMNELILQEESF